MKRTFWGNLMIFEPDEYPVHGEELPPSFIRGAAEFHAHEAFHELTRVYGREQAAKLWGEIPEEYDDETR
jgi:hypothetical protein